MKRGEVYRMIDGERAYQQAQGKPDERYLPDWLDSVSYYLDKAHIAREASDKPETLAHIRKIAALAVAALEQYGCPPREGYEVDTDTGSAGGRMTEHWDIIEDALAMQRRLSYNEAQQVTDDIDAALAFVREMRKQPPVPVSEIRLVTYALKAWWTFGSEASLPSQTEIRDLEIVEQWLDAQPKGDGNGV